MWAEDGRKASRARGHWREVHKKSSVDYLRGSSERERGVGPARGRQYDAVTGQPADREFPQNSERLSWRWRLREGSAPRKRRKTGLSSRSRVGFAKARDWVVDRTEHKLA